MWKTRAQCALCRRQESLERLSTSIFYIYVRRRREKPLFKREKLTRPISNPNFNANHKLMTISKRQWPRNVHGKNVVNPPRHVLSVYTAADSSGVQRFVPSYRRVLLGQWHAVVIDQFAMITGCLSKHVINLPFSSSHYLPRI